MEHPKRRTYERVVFDPSGDSLTGVPSIVEGREDFNTWPGFALTAASEGSCDLFLDHLRNVVCCGDADSYRWAIMWLAAIVQRPEELPGTALVLCGAQGTGKSLVGEVMKHTIGESLYTLVSGVDELTGRFNAHQENKLLIQVEEAFFAGDKRIVGQLKNMITSPTVRIERKGIDAFSVANCARLLITSNERWVVPAEMGERRFMVLNVSPDRAHALRYFAALRKQMFEEGGCARLLHHLLYEVDIDWDAIRRPLATDALRDQQMETFGPEQRWLLDLLIAGVLPGDISGEGIAPTEDIYQSYRASLHEQGTPRRAASKEACGRFLKQYGVDKPRLRPGSEKGPRSYHWQFPPLAKCRATFERGLATPIAWGDVSDWQPEFGVQQ